MRPRHEAERQIGIVNLEEDRYVRICCSAGLDTECALKWAEEIIKLKRRELSGEEVTGCR